MTTTTATTPAVTLPAPVPAAVSARRANATARKAKAATKTGRKPQTPTGVTNFQVWKDSIDTARQAAGYDTTSPIYGKTDLEVLNAINSVLESISTLIDSKAITFDEIKQAADDLRTLQIDELLKRKVAKQIAGQTYKSRRP